MVTNASSAGKGSKGAGPHNIFVQRSDQAVGKSPQQSE